VSLSFRIELELEDDGRWIAEVPDLAGVLCYGATRDEAIARVQALALRVLAERLDHAEAPAEGLSWAGRHIRPVRRDRDAQRRRRVLPDPHDEVVALEAMHETKSQVLAGRHGLAVDLHARRRKPPTANHERRVDQGRLGAGSKRDLERLRGGGAFSRHSTS